jgi:hypothetical protein
MAEDVVDELEKIRNHYDWLIECCYTHEDMSDFAVNAIPNLINMIERLLKNNQMVQ